MPALDPYLPFSGELSSGSLLVAEEGDRGKNPPWEKASLRVLIARLSSFPDVSRSNPHLFLFAASRRAEKDAFIDFSFLSTPRDRALLSESRLQAEFGVFSGAHPADFDVILVSNAYSLELLNLIPFLKRSGIPPRLSSRSASALPCPLIVLGGSAASASFALFEDPARGRGDCLVDAVFFGEGEGRVEEIVRLLASERGKRGPFAGDARAEALALLALNVKGFFSPLAGTSAVQSVIGSGEGVHASLLEDEFPVLDSSEASTVRLSITRGCPSFCSFCMEGWDRKPYREIQADTVLATARAAKLASGADGLELSSFNFNSHSDIVRLLIGLNLLFMDLSAMSQRADILISVPGLLALEFSGGKRSYTVGVEGISERMRGAYAKGLGESALMKLLERLLDARAREIKLFYIVSGDEDESDLREFGEFAKALKHARGSRSPGTRILCSAGYLVRMPGTPLGGAPNVRSETELRAISGPMKSSCDTNGIEFRLASSYPEYALNQLFADGSAPGFRILEHLAEGGYEHPGYLPAGAYEAAKEVLGEKLNSNPGGKAFAFLERPVNEAFRASFLESRKGLPADEPASCLGGNCLSCGACPPEGIERSLITEHAIAEARPKSVERLASIMKEKASIRPRAFWADVPPALAGAESSYLASWAMRKLFARSPGQADNALMARELLFTRKPASLRISGFSGKTLFGFWAWDAESLDEALASGLGWAPYEAVLTASPVLEPLSFEARIVVPLAGRKAMEEALTAYLEEEKAPFVLGRQDDGFTLDVSDKGLKKRILSAVVLKTAADAKKDAFFGVAALAHFDFKRIAARYCLSAPRGMPPRLAVDEISEIGKGS